MFLNGKIFHDIATSHFSRNCTIRADGPQRLKYFKNGPLQKKKFSNYWFKLYFSVIIIKGI